MDSKELENQIRFFKYYSAGVNAYEYMASRKAESFAHGVRRQKFAEEINGIYGSNVLLAKIITGIAVHRYLFEMAVRERSNYIDFTKVGSDPKYIAIRDKILKNDKSLTHADCDKIILKICNSIAHGNIVKSFDFDMFSSEISAHYQKHKTLDTKDFVMASDYAKLIRKCWSLHFNYESRFEIDKDGKRIKRTTPAVFELEIAPEDITDLMDLVENCVSHIPCYYALAENYIEEGTVGPDGMKINTKNIPLDKYQLSTIDEVQNDFIDFFSDCRDADAEGIKKAGLMIGIFRALVEDKTYLKLRELFAIVATLPANLSDAKRSIKQIVDDASNYAAYKLKQTPVQIANSIYNSNPSNAYKYLLVSEVATMLETIENCALKTELAKFEVVDELSKAYHKKTSTTEKEKTQTIDKIRNSFVHGNYIVRPSGNFEIYDHKSPTDESLEHKFTLNIKQLEQIRTSCMDTFKTKQSELAALEAYAGLEK